MNTITTITKIAWTSFFMVCSSFAVGQNERDITTDATNPNYRLSVRDRISITVFDEPNLAMAQGIDVKGEIRLPLIGTFSVAGMTIREVERLLEEKYVGKKIVCPLSHWMF
jgi:protein involved in polysaccharide export with SLBB domain